jgi:hypothetical protein
MYAAALSGKVLIIAEFSQFIHQAIQRPGIPVGAGQS